MSIPTTLLALSLASAPIPSPHTPITSDPGARGQSEFSRLTGRPRRLAAAGSVVLIAGGFAWGTLAGALIFGAMGQRSRNSIVTAENAALRAPDAHTRAVLERHDAEGQRNNTAAIVSAVVATALTVVGAALLGRGSALGRRQARLAALGTALRLDF